MRARRHERDPISQAQHDLIALANSVSGLPGVRKAQLSPGDTLVVETRNSFYVIGFEGGDGFSVAGGWFDANGSTPTNVRINGCTWGGRAIMTDMVAAPGLFLEFGNGVRTTRIMAVSRLVRSARPDLN
jgi:hypothetical protein